MNARLLILGLALLTALACGESGSNQASGGVGGSGVSRGPITAFGSVVVTGIKWNTDSADFEIDGNPATQDDLAVGMIVTVEGDVDGDGATGTATAVTVDDELEGPIDSITPVGTGDTAATIVVLGVDVYVEDGTTLFDDDGLGSTYDFASMMVGDVVEVSGFRDETGTIRATYIERYGALDPGVTQVELDGEVSNFTPGGTSFQIGSVTVNFDPTGVTTDLSELPSGPDNGQFVEVEGVIEANGEITASKIEFEDDELPDVDNAEIEGVITRFVSLTDMDVAGQPVDASGATLTPADETLYKLGTVVEAEGPLAGGVLIARKLKLRGFDTRIEAAIDSNGDIDSEAGTFVLLGIPVTTDASTQFEDGVGDSTNLLEDLIAGEFVSVRGIEHPAGTLYATRVKREDDDDVELRGFLGPDSVDVDAETLTVLGVTVDVSIATFEDENEAPLTLAEFFASIASGDLVEMKNDLPGNPAVLGDADDPFATEVERETSEASPGLPPSFFPGVVAAQPAVPSVAAMLDDLGAFGPAPDDELQRVEEFDFELDYAAQPANWANSAQGASATKDSDQLSMVDAVVVFFERIREVVAEKDASTVSED